MAASIRAHARAQAVGLQSSTRLAAEFFETLSKRK